LESLFHGGRPTGDVIEYRAIATINRSIANTTHKQTAVVDRIREFARHGNAKVVTAVMSNSLLDI
jgi:hypothetical protein